MDLSNSKVIKQTVEFDRSMVKPPEDRVVHIRATPRKTLIDGEKPEC